MVVERFTFTSPPPLRHLLSTFPSTSLVEFFKVPVTDDVTTLKTSTAVKIKKDKHNEVAVRAL